MSQLCCGDSLRNFFCGEKNSSTECIRHVRTRCIRPGFPERISGPVSWLVGPLVGGRFVGPVIRPRAALRRAAHCEPGDTGEVERQVHCAVCTSAATGL